MSSEIARQASDSLLETILREPALARELASLPTDVKTLELTPTRRGAVASSPSPDPNAATHLLRVDSSSVISSHDSAVATEEIPQRRVDQLGKPPTISSDNSRNAQRHADHPDYRVVGELGSGGTGIVFQAHQRAVDREVAVKMLRPELAADPVSREHFLTEARVIGGLDHPNVIALHEVYEDQSGNLYYSMKRINGTSWNQQISEASEASNIDTLLRVADGIRYAHSRGLVHRDIKPENVMLGKFGEVLLADWGLAVNRRVPHLTDNSRHSIGGTPAYMAPELATGLVDAIDFRTDVYLLGATLFHVLTGHPPHQGKTLLECIENAANNVIVETEIDNELMDIAMKAMATEPGDRFESVDQFIEAIQEVKLHEQSNRLVRRAAEHVQDANQTNSYENYGVADALLKEAITIWPTNQCAIRQRKKVQLGLAELAVARGDLDLAIEIFESTGEADSDASRRAKDQLRRRASSEQRVSRYSALFAKSPEAGLLLDMKNKRIAEVNEAFGKLFGRDRSQITGMLIEDLNQWTCPARRSKFLQQLERDGEVDDFEAIMKHQDGHPVHVLISCRIIEIDGTPMLVSTLRDITQRKEAEEDLKRNRERLRDLQRLAGLATWSYDVKTDQVSWSEETFAISGRDHTEGTPTREELYRDLIHPDDHAKLRMVVSQAIQQGNEYEIEIRQRGSSGDYEDFVIRGQPIANEQGETIEVYGVLIPKRPGK